MVLSRAAKPGLIAAVVLGFLAGGAVQAGSRAAANSVALDRVARAVLGVETSDGTDPAMWRPDPDGPQGPMQVSAAAAADVGNGDRFDPTENLLLGRAYLARLYQRYANWADAVAAYNWGPARMDTWIESGRPSGELPPTVALYRVRVLSGASAPGRNFGMARHMQPRRSLADRRHPSRDSIAVEQLYRAIMANNRP
ncbi:MAG: lytic transglycosylase domain-containing protein [Stellaceae bacterium]